MTCKSVQYVKEERSAKLKAALNKTSTWEQEILKISGKVNSNTYKDGSDIAIREVRLQTDKLAISGVYRYSVKIQKQGSSVSCRGELIVYSKFIIKNYMHPLVYSGLFIKPYMKILNDNF